MKWIEKLFDSINTVIQCTTVETVFQELMKIFLCLTSVTLLVWHVLEKLASHVCSVSLNFYHCYKYWNLQLNQVKQDIRGTSTVVLGSDTSFVSRAALSDLDAFGKSQGWVPHFPRCSTGSLQFLMSNIEASLPARSWAKAYLSWCGSTRWYADGKALWC